MLALALTVLLAAPPLAAPPRVNVLVQGDQTWDECGPRMTNEGAGTAQFWILADGAEAWLNVPECELFATREEAVRNQQRR
ncbi:MAG TPA: hypothetical protein VEB43_16100 [Anaeromyxobacter sp.]|nr:hypothetical protein [Anaeromyxobacter sp.]